jgi:hypothetical protein
MPRTQVPLILNNAYRPNVSQPPSFNVLEFVILKPTNMKVIAARRYVRGTLKDNNQLIYPLPNFM